MRHGVSRPRALTPSEAGQSIRRVACSRARGVTEADLTRWGAKFANPTMFTSLVEWADRIITP